MRYSPITKTTHNQTNGRTNMTTIEFQVGILIVTFFAELMLYAASK
jgi:hypothetical protein